MSELVRKIIHIDMDAFYASVEQRDHPQWYGLPVIVGGPPQGRGVVATCSYEARQYGIHSAMPTYKAYKLCPHAVFTQPKLAKYRQVSKEIHSIFREYTNKIEPLSLDEAYLDVTDNYKKIASAQEIAWRIRKQIYDQLKLTASAGVSYNKFIAKVASGYQKPNGQTVVPPEKGLEFVASLKIEKFHGIGPKSSAKLKDLNIHTGADFRQLSLATLQDFFGTRAEYFYQAARGIDNRSVEPHSLRKSWSQETTFSQNCSDLEELKKQLAMLIKQLASSMQTKKIKGRCITVKLKYNDFSNHSKSITLVHFTNDQLSIQSNSFALLTALFSGEPVRLIGIRLSRLDNRPLEKLPLFESLDLN